MARSSSGGVATCVTLCTFGFMDVVTFGSSLFVDVVETLFGSSGPYGDAWLAALRYNKGNRNSTLSAELGSR